MRKRWKQRLSVALSAAMVLSAVNIGPLYASEGSAKETILGFEELEESCAFQTLPMGAGETDIRFPASLWADLVIEDAEYEAGGVEKATESDAGKPVENATESDAEKPMEKATGSNAASGGNDEDDEDSEEAFEIELVNDLETGTEFPVKKRISDIRWILKDEGSTAQTFQSDQAGVYLYEPVIPSKYQLHEDAVLPQIVVRVGIDLFSAEVSTELVDGILTITGTKGSGTGWGWNGAKLDMNASLKDCKQIVFASGITPQIMINRGNVILAPENGEPAISASGDITITSTQGTAGNGMLTVQGSIDAPNVTITGTAKVVADGAELFHADSGEKLSLNFSGNGALTSENGGSIYLAEGAMVEGMANVLSDQGKTFATNGVVTVGAEDAPAADNQLTAGSYVGTGGLFTKSSGGGAAVTTGLKDGILTITSSPGGVVDEGWSWNGALLNVNSKFAGNQQIVFAAGVAPEIKVNSGITLTPGTGEPAILASEDLTINALKNITLKGSIQAKDVTIKGAGQVVVDGSELIRVESGQTLKLDGGTLVSKNGGSIYLAEGTMVEGMANVLSDQGKTFVTNGVVTVGAEDAPAADNQLTAGSYVGTGGLFTKSSGGGGAAVTTGLKDGILTVTSSPGGVVDEGWSWNGALLNVNSKFAGNQQIVFAAGVAPEIKVNSGITLTPRTGEPAILASEDLTINALKNITLKGSIQAKDVIIKGAGQVVVDGSELIRVESGQTLKLDGGTLTSLSGGSIYFCEGANVEGMADVLSDQGKAFATNGVVTVGAEDTLAADDQLTAGSYVGTEGLFAKGSSGGDVTVSTGLKDGILTITKTAGSEAEEGWAWNGAILNVNSKFAGNQQIVFAAGVTPEIKVNSGITLTPKAGEPAILASEDLTIHALKNITLKGSVQAKDVTIKGAGQVVVDGSELIRVESGQTLKLDGGTLTSLSGGSIYFCEGANVEGMADVLSDQGKAFTAAGAVTVVAEDTPAADNQLTAGSYVGIGGLFTKGGSGGDVTVTTGLKDGILTITTEKGGVKEEGWAWNGGRLDLNDKFAGNKQIIFTAGVTPSIKINREITITPDAGKPAITAAGDLTIVADAKLKLAAGGSIEAKSVTIKGSASVEVQADSGNAAILAKNGAVVMSDTAVVAADGAIEANGDIVIDGSANLVANVDRFAAAVYAKQGAITIRGLTTVIACNQSGAAMNPAPDTSSYADIRISVSEQAGGKPAAEYDAGRIDSYRYLKIEKLLSLGEIEDSVENLDSNAAPALVDALADQIRSLPPDERKDLKPETIEKVDLLLQEATGIKAVPSIEAPMELSGNKQIQNAQIHGALLAAGITLADSQHTQLELRIRQKKPENKAALTFECDLLVNGEKISLKVPVEVIVELPPEFYPLRGYQIHHVGEGIDEWIDFVYNGADNTTRFWTSSFSTFSIVNTSSSSGGGSGSGGSGGGGGGGGGSRSLAGSALSGKAAGRWVWDAAGWWYQNADKSYPKDGWATIRYNGKDEWYLFDKNGYMVTGWAFWNGSWYYLSTAPDGSSGIMLTGWQTIDGRRYYFSEAVDGTKGAKLTNIWIGEFYLDQDGVAQAGRTRH